MSQNTAIHPLGAQQPAYTGSQQQNPNHNVQPLGEVPPATQGQGVFSPQTPYQSGYGGQPQQPQGVYGQNSAAAQQDQHRYQQQQQQQQWQQQQQQQQQWQQQPHAASYQPTDPYFVSVAVVGPAAPPGLLFGEQEDLLITAPYHNGLLVLAAILLLIAVITIISTIAKFNVASLVIFIIAAIALFFVGWFTTESQVRFMKPTSEVQVLSRRLILHPCGFNAVQRVPFSSLTNVTFSETAQRNGRLSLLAGGQTIDLGARYYVSMNDMNADILAWHTYIATLRGVTVEQLLGRVGQMIGGLMNAIANPNRI